MNLNSLVLLKFEPTQVLFIDRQTRQVYRYMDIKQPSQPYPQHEHLMNGIFFQDGILYGKQESTLYKQIQQRCQFNIKQQFSEQQIVNTFQPLYDCLQYLHKQGIVHGQIHPKNIVVIDEQIKLRDGLAHGLEQYYNIISKEEDYKALGFCLLNCILLKTHRPDLTLGQCLLQQLVWRFSRSFALFLVIIIKQKVQYYSMLPTLLRGGTSFPLQVVEVYQRIRNEKQKKIKHFSNELSSPFVFKKFAIGTPKKIVHSQNIENKIQGQRRRSGNNMKEKQKLSQKLIKKMNDSQKKIKEESIKGSQHKQAILNLSNFGLEHNTIKKKDFKSPAQRRTFSKKK